MLALNTLPKRLMTIVAILGLLNLTACTSVNPYTGQTQASDTAIGAGIGTIGGALAGAVLGGGKGALIGGALGGITGTAIGNGMDRQNAELRERLVGTGVQVNQVGNSIQLVMASDVTFATNRAEIASSFYPTLNSVAMVLRKYNRTSINITGFTDNTGGDAYNQDLSERRAQSVGAFLISQGISPNRVFTTGMGKRNPIASNATATGRAQNRRVVILLRPLG